VDGQFVILLTGSALPNRKMFYDILRSDEYLSFSYLRENAMENAVLQPCCGSWLMYCRMAETTDLLAGNLSGAMFFHGTSETPRRSIYRVVEGRFGAVDSCLMSYIERITVSDSERKYGYRAPMIIANID
jgi:hypothetical protein